MFKSKRIPAFFAALALALPVAPAANAYDEICVRNHGAFNAVFRVQFKTGVGQDEGVTRTVSSHGGAASFPTGLTRCISRESLGNPAPGALFQVRSQAIAGENELCQHDNNLRWDDDNNPWHRTFVWPHAGGGRLQFDTWGVTAALHCEVEAGMRMWDECERDREGFAKPGCYPFRPDKDGSAAYDLTADEGKGIAHLVSAVNRGADMNFRKNDENPLHAAVRLDRLDHTRVLLGQGEHLNNPPRRSDVEARDGGQRTPLHVAARLNLPEHVRALLLQNPNVNPADQGGQTPLLAAIHHNIENTRGLEQEAMEDIINQLLADGADPNIADGDGRLPLHRAAGQGDFDVINILIAGGADAYRKDVNGKSALQHAVEGGRETWDGIADSSRRAIEGWNNTARKILFDLNLRQATGSVYRDVPRVAELIVYAGNDWADPNVIGDDDLPAIVRVFKTGIPDAAVHLAGASGINLDATEPDGKAAIHHAVEQSHEAALRALLENGADIHLQVNGVAPIEQATNARNAEFVRILRDAGSALDFVNDADETPLIVAAKNNWHEIVQILLDGGAQTGVVDASGKTALDHATLLAHPESELALILAGADRAATTENDRAVNRQDSAGNAILHRVARTVDMARVRAILAQQPNVNLRNRYGATPLMAAIASNSTGRDLTELTRALLDAGANPRLADSDGRTPAHDAALYNMAGPLALMLENGMSPAVRDPKANLPLVAHAVIGGAPDTLRLLLEEHGQDPNQRFDIFRYFRTTAESILNHGAFTLLSHAVQMDLDGDTVLVLLDAGASQQEAARDPWGSPRSGARSEHLDPQGPGASGVHPQRRAARRINDAGLAHLLTQGGGDIDDVQEAIQDPARFPITYAFMRRHFEEDGLLHYETPSAEYVIDFIRENPRDRDGIDRILNRGRPNNSLPDYNRGSPDPNRFGDGGHSAVHVAAGDSEAALRIMLSGSHHHDWVADVNQRAANGGRPLHWALNPSPDDGSDPLTRVRLLLENGADVNAANDRGEAPLHRAAWKGYAVYFQFLLDHGADPNLTDNRGRTPLDRVAASARAALELATLNRPDAAGRTPLHRALAQGDAAAAQSLLERGADPNLRDSDGNTPLMLGILQGGLSAALAETLLENGAERHRLNNAGDTPLSAAALRGMAPVVRALVAARARGDYPRRDGWLPLQLAADRKSREVDPAADADFAETVAALLNAGGADLNAAAPNGKTPFQMALESGDAPVLGALAAAGADINAPGPDDRTPLMVAAQKPDGAIVRILLENGATGEGANLGQFFTVDGDEALMEALADFGVHDEGNLLHNAAASGDEPLVNLLLGYNADPNLPNANGETPLMLAAAAGHFGPVLRLLQKGADPNQTAADGNSLLFNAVAAGQEEILVALAAEGASAENLPQGWLLTAVPALENEPILLLLNQGAPTGLDQLNPQGKNAIHLAAAAGRTDLIQKFLEDAEGPQVALRDSNGRRPIYYARQGGHDDIVVLLEDLSIDPNALAAGVNGEVHGYRLLHSSARAGNAEEVARWIRLGADLNARTSNGGWTPLLVMAGLFADSHNWTEGHSDSAVAILQAGAEVDATDPNGQTALHRAAYQGNPWLIKILLDHDADPFLEYFGRDALERFHQGGAEYAQRTETKDDALALLQAEFDKAGRSDALRAAAADADADEVAAVLTAMRAEGVDDEAALADLLAELMPAALNLPDGQIALNLADAAADRSAWNLNAAPALNAQGDDGGTILHRSAWNIADRIANLVDAGANPEAADNAGRTPLLAAIQAGQYQAVDNLMKLEVQVNEAALAAALVAGGDIGARVNRDPDAPRDDGTSWMQTAVQTGDAERLRRLIEQDGGDPNGTLPDGAPYLLIAIIRNHQPMADVLLENGADPNGTVPAGWTDLEGKSLLQVAWEEQKPGMLIALLENGVNTRISASDLTHIAAKNGISEPGDEPHMAWHDILDIFNALAARGANFNLRDYKGNTSLNFMPWLADTGILPGNDGDRDLALQVAKVIRDGGGACVWHSQTQHLETHPVCTGGTYFYSPPATGFDTALLDAVVEGDAAGVAEALENGADPNRATNNKHLLERAILADNGRAVADVLLEGGSDPNGEDRHGVSFLYGAWYWKNAEVMVALLEAGANPNVEWRDASLLHHLAVNGLSSRGGEPHLPWEEILEVAEAAAEAGADFSQRDRSGSLPLNHLPWRVDNGIAADNDSDRAVALELAALMREHGGGCSDALASHPVCAGEDAPADAGALAEAADAAIVGGDEVALAAALADGADPNGTDRHGVALLYVAWYWKNAGMMKMLLQSGADPNVEWRDASLPHHLAVNGVTSAGGESHLSWADVLEVAAAAAAAGADFSRLNGAGHAPLNHLPWRVDAGIGADNEGDRELALELASLMRENGGECVAHRDVNTSHRVCTGEAQ